MCKHFEIGEEERVGTFVGSHTVVLTFGSLRVAMPRERLGDLFLPPMAHDEGQMTGTLSERLVEARRAAGLKQSLVAEELGVSINTVSRWETGFHVPSHAAVYALASLYGISPSSLEGPFWSEVTRPVRKKLT